MTCKPDPEIYRCACARVGVDPVRTVFVDDTDDMLVGVAAVGLTPIKFVGQPATIKAINDVLDGRSTGWHAPREDPSGQAPEVGRPEDLDGGLRH